MKCSEIRDIDPVWFAEKCSSRLERLASKEFKSSVDPLLVELAGITTREEVQKFNLPPSLVLFACFNPSSLKARFLGTLQKGRDYTQTFVDCCFARPSMADFMASLEGEGLVLLRKFLKREHWLKLTPLQIVTLKPVTAQEVAIVQTHPRWPEICKQLGDHIHTILSKLTEFKHLNPNQRASLDFNHLSQSQFDTFLLEGLELSDIQLECAYKRGLFKRFSYLRLNETQMQRLIAFIPEALREEKGSINGWVKKHFPIDWPDKPLLRFYGHILAHIPPATLARLVYGFEGDHWVLWTLVPSHRFETLDFSQRVDFLRLFRRPHTYNKQEQEFLKFVFKNLSDQKLSSIATYFTPFHYHLLKDQLHRIDFSTIQPTEFTLEKTKDEAYFQEGLYRAFLLQLKTLGTYDAFVGKLEQDMQKYSANLLAGSNDK